MKPSKDHTSQLKVQQNKASFTRILNRLILDETVDATSKGIYIIIAYHYPNAFPSLPLIAKRAMVTRKTATKHVAILVEKGYLTRDIKNGRGYVYGFGYEREFNHPTGVNFTRVQVGTGVKKDPHPPQKLPLYPPQKLPPNHTNITILNNQRENFSKNEPVGSGGVPADTLEELKKLGMDRKPGDRSRLKDFSASPKRPTPTGDALK